MYLPCRSRGGLRSITKSALHLQKTCMWNVYTPLHTCLLWFKHCQSFAPFSNFHKHGDVCTCTCYLLQIPDCHTHITGLKGQPCLQGNMQPQQELGGQALVPDMMYNILDIFNPHNAKLTSAAAAGGHTNSCRCCTRCMLVLALNVCQCCKRCTSVPLSEPDMMYRTYWTSSTLAMPSWTPQLQLESLLFLMPSDHDQPIKH